MGPRNRGTWGLSALLFVVAVGAHLQSLGFDFHYDDFHSIVNNKSLRDVRQLPVLFADPSRFSVNPESAMYRPVLLASYVANHLVIGAAPGGFHAVNVLLHGLNAALIFRLLLALRQPLAVSLVGTLFFALHPLNTEAVSYVSSRSELLMAFFFTATCLAHLRFVSGDGRRWYGAALTLAAAAMLTKSVAITLVPFLILIDWWRMGGKYLRLAWARYLPYAAIAFVYIVISRRIVDRALFEPVRGLDVQLWTQLKAGIYALFLVGMPVKLSVHHQFFLSRIPDQVVLMAAVALASIGCVVWGLRRGRILPASAGWVLFLLTPSFAVPLIVLFNEHRIYLATVGIAVALSWCLTAGAFGRHVPGRSLVALFAGLLLILTVQRSSVWSDEVSLWSDAAVKSPLMVKPHLRLADALFQRELWLEAEREYSRALELKPRHPNARSNLGILYRRQGRLKEARAQFETVLAVYPDNVPARLNLAGLFGQLGEFDRAAAEFARTLGYSHTDGVAQGHLGRIALQQGRPAEAVHYYSDGLAVAPRDGSMLVGRAVARRALGENDLAENDYRAAIAVDALNADAWYNLGNLLRQLGRTREAVMAFEEVVGIGSEKELSEAAAVQIAQLLRSP